MNTGASHVDPPRSVYGRPFLWLIFALIALLVPTVGYMIEAELPWERAHPAINALLNGTCFVFLVAGWRAIRRGNREFHRQCMLAAFAASTVFLISYLTRYAMSGSHVYPGDGWDRVVYLVILMSHMVLATAVVPLVLRALYLGLRGRFPKHRGIARWTWPIWMYVSFTGVVVYLMLYPIAGAVYGG